MTPKPADTAALPIYGQEPYQNFCRLCSDEKNDGRTLPVPIEFISLGSNIRTNIDVTHPRFLAMKDTIEKDGLYHHVTVMLEDGKPTLKAGFRRLTSCKMLGHDTIRVMIKNKAGSDGELIQIYENIHREDLDPLDFCEALKVIKRKENISNLDKLASHVGLKDRGIVGYYLKAADWPPEAKALFRKSGLLNRSHIFKIARFKESNDPMELIRLIEQHALLAQRQHEKQQESSDPSNKEERPGTGVDPLVKKHIDTFLKARTDVPKEIKIRLRKMAVTYSSLSKSERKAFADMITKL